jgi:hypothetical protein
MRLLSLAFVTAALGMALGVAVPAFAQLKVDPRIPEYRPVGACPTT